MEENLTKLNIELRVLIDSLESEREKFLEAVPKQIKSLEGQIKNISNTNIMLQSIPKKMEDKFHESIPEIAAKLDSLNEANLQKLEEGYLEVAKRHAELFSSSEIKLKKLVENLDSIDTRKTKRFFLGVGFAVFISVCTSVSASYLMMRSFPLKAIINHPENIILNESQVSLWGTDNVKVLKK